jgi:hypothetical protein
MRKISVLSDKSEYLCQALFLPSYPVIKKALIHYGAFIKASIGLFSFLLAITYPLNLLFDS